MFEKIDVENISLRQLKKYCTDNYKVRSAELGEFNRKKQVIKFMTENYSESEELFNDLELEDSKDDPNIEKTIDVKRSDEKWTSWVLGHLADDEKQDGVPTCDGLRRLVEKFIGPIFRIKTEVSQAPSIENGLVSTIVVKIEFYDNLLGTNCEFEGVGEVQKEHTPYPYNQFLTTSAETKAESRVLKKILRLKNVVCYEEGKQEEKVFNHDKESILVDQIRFIDTMASIGRTNVDASKIFESVTGKKLPTKQYSSNDAQMVVEVLQKYQKKPDDIPEEHRGYNPHWVN